jgi:cytochrome c oxidase assembly protein subunit 15
VLIMNRLADPKASGGGDILTLGFGTTVAMWAAGYVCRLPGAGVPGWVLMVLMLACLLGGGLVAGLRTGRGWKGGLYVTLVASVLNLLILGSLLSGDQPNRVVPSALWWIPGSFLVAALLGVIGASVGSSLRKAEPAKANWRGAFAKVLAAATLLLLIIGGLVTSKKAGLSVVDWPNSFGYSMFLYPLSRMTGGIYYEHAHRVFGSLVGLTTLVFAVYMQRSEGRAWLRRLAWLALLVVITQGVLGGLRVTGRFTTSTSPEDMSPNIVLAIVHGTLGQLFFSMVVAMAVLTSTAWRRAHEPTERASAGTDRTLSVILVLLLLVQIVLGAVLRHKSGGLHIHIAIAVVVILAALNSGLRAWGLYTQQPILQRVGHWLVWLAVAQGILGIAAWAAVWSWAEVETPSWARITITTAHQANGAILLACAVSLMLWCHRLLVPARAATSAESPVA